MKILNNKHQSNAEGIHDKLYVQDKIVYIDTQRSTIKHMIQILKIKIKIGSWF